MEEDIEYLEQFIGIKKEYKYKPIKAKTLNNTRQAIKNLIAENKQLKGDLYASNCIVNEQIDLLRDSIPKSKAEELLEKLDKEEKQELKGAKGQDRYFIKQIYSAKRSTIQELLQER